MNIEKTLFLNWQTADEIAKKFSTPCYVYDEAALEEQAKKALSFPNAFGITVRYAMKAASNKEILRLFSSLGLHIDASSAYEVKRAILAGIPRIIFIKKGRGRSNLYTYLRGYRSWGFVCKNWKSNE